MLKADLNWLPTSLFKGIIYPTVIYEDDIDQKYGGYYTHGTNELVVVESGDTNASTIAHEFKHYLQHQKYKIPGSIWKLTGTYEESIYRYFHSYWWEMEALLFEHKIAKDWNNDWWLRKLVRRN